ncbi:unnamed protein product [Brassicogethes aeneus]|uniref:C2H2-type domain-containing protein n=1 Tax=Brassicogethes aeneus TaxID=1431903 RepID=A0A9P0B9H5_BRAAE|nr:unnamed protein product [Brassicogethes aeneus]
MQLRCQGDESVQLEPEVQEKCLGPNTKPELKCDMCLFETNVEEEYNVHSEIHNTKICPYCNLQFISNMVLQGHVLAKHKRLNILEKKIAFTYQCTRCTFATISLGKYAKHVTLCLCEIYYCRKCKFKTSDAKTYKTHRTKCTPKTTDIKTYNMREISCSQCSYTTKIQKDFELHYKKHLDENLTCPYCELKVTKSRDLQQHVFCTHKQQNEVEKKVEVAITSLNCKKCSFKTVRKDLYETHVQLCEERLDIDVKQEILVCPYCDFLAASTLSLKLHVCKSHKQQNNVEKKVDTSIKKYYISCNKNDNKQLHFLKKHVLTKRREQNGAEKNLENRPIEEKHHYCPYCHYKSIFNFHLQRHVYRDHREQNEKEKKVKITIKINYCDNCNYSYTDYAEFRRHAKKCTKGPLFQCPDCIFSTNSEEKHNIHVKYNTNFELTCSSCPFTSKCRPSYYIHREKHRKIEVKEVVLLHCPDCSYSTNCKKKNEFAREFLEHKKKHMKLEVCPYCKYSAYNNQVMQRHVHNNHKEQNDVENKVKITGKVF